MMKANKTTRIIYWLTTGILFLFEGVLVAFTFQSELAQEGIRHLGYPAYFGTLLALFKVTGAVVLIFPVFSPRLKEWTYAGFTFTIFSAFVSHLVMDGIHLQTFLPLAFLLLLGFSYTSYQALQEAHQQELYTL